MPITIRDCKYCGDPPMISADWLGRNYVVNCFCYSHKQADGYTAKLAIERWNEKNANEKDKTDTETTG